MIVTTTREERSPTSSNSAGALVLVDLSNAVTDVRDAWRRSGFLERAEALGDQIAFFDPHGRLGSEFTGVFADFQKLLSHARAAGRDVIAVVEAEQLFVDIRIATALVDNFRTGRWDYGTQWEHCRLPVGIGIRCLSATRAAEDGAESPQAFFARIHAAPESFAVLYDDTPYTDLALSLLDARAGAALSRVTEGWSPPAGGWSLDGFRALAAATGTDLRYSPGPVPQNARLDERKMPAAYGFESEAGAEFPSYIMFDLTNRCNATCIHCPQSAGFEGSDETVMLLLDRYKQVIDECVGREIDFVRITADGEPLLHPDAFEMMAYAVEQGVGPVGLTTNGSALTPRNVEKLLDAGIFMTDISLDAYSAETFETVRAGLSFDRTVGNVLNLLKRRDERGSSMKIMVSFVKQKENVDELDDFIAYWEPKVDRVLVREMISNVGINDVSGSSEDHAAVRWPCPHWYRRVVVNYDGNVKACPIDWNNALVAGSLADASVEETWHNDYYRNHRLQHQNLSFRDDSICKNCRDWQGTPWNLGYEKVIKAMRD